MRSWLSMAVAPLGGQVSEAGDGLELLYQIAEGGPFDIIICSRALPSIAGEQVLTMIRTAGDQTPFLLIAPFCRKSIRALIDKLPNTAIIDDPLDGAEILRLSKALIAECTLAA